MKHIIVAAGIIYNSQGQILISKRPADKPSAGLWEFPGGKVEVGEQPEQALCRELKEELAIQVTEYSPYTQLEFAYPDRHISLFIFEVSKFEGQPKSIEQQEIQWVKKGELHHYHFLEANKTIIQQLQSIPK